MDEQNQPTQQNQTSEQDKERKKTDSYSAKKERKDLKRERKILERISREKNKKTKKLLIVAGLIALAVVVVGLIAWIVIVSWDPLSPDLSIEMPEEGKQHLKEGDSITYESNPPTSGSHWPVSLADDVYDTEKPDEAIIHSLEHGRIWVSYRPSIPEETKENLKNLLRGEGAVILTPRSANETDIALAAWRRLDIFDIGEDGNFDEKRILDFIKRYRLKGPEFVPMGQGGGKTYE